ncbi:LuxR C-terminal-related transcriptional regulator [Antarctobacter sp.]|uniref:LuxR C-terminal-related transcriptional regulator n=1 Tax=Antarctobacter sp. TaxID=1872577 RepID=UPI002B2709E3|nr:LuxR C-terminal-related transcriptional regulator [Antarctobacter sp.]
MSNLPSTTSIEPETRPAIRYPRHPAHLDPFVEELGAALAVRFLIAFAGSTLYFPTDPRGRSAAEAVIGKDRLQALGARMPSNRAEVPVPRTWLILALTAEGKSTADICRALKVTAKTVKTARRENRWKVPT